MTTERGSTSPTRTGRVGPTRCTRSMASSARRFDPTVENVSTLVHADDRETYLAIVRDAIATRTPFACQHRIVRPDGDTRVVIIRGSFVEGFADTPDRLIGTTQDVTDTAGEEERLVPPGKPRHGLRPLQPQSLHGGAHARDRVRAAQRRRRSAPRLEPRSLLRHQLRPGPHGRRSALAEGGDRAGGTPSRHGHARQDRRRRVRDDPSGLRRRMPPAGLPRN